MLKKCILIISTTLSLLLPISTFCQWTTVNVGTTGDLNTIAFAGNSIFLGGQVFCKSTDGGAGWNTYPLLDDMFNTIFGSELYDLHFFDEDTGLATGFILLGNSEVILRTTNGGLNWSFVNVNNVGDWPRLLNDIDFPTATTGYAVGSNGRILKSTDSGQTWSALTSGTTRELRAVHFMNATTGIAAGDGIILKTTNGGNTWTTSNFPGQAFNDIHFINPAEGAVIGGGGILKTVNGGDFWAAVPGSIEGNTLYLVGADTIFVGGSGISQSINGGQYFLPQPSVPDNETFNKLDFFNNTTGYAVGEEGIVRRTASFGDPFALNDAGVSEIEPFPLNPCPDVFPVRITLHNRGLHNLTSATINWEVNGQAQAPYFWTGDLTSAQSSGFFTIGSYFFPLGDNSVKVWSSDPNAGPDDFAGNDTLISAFPLNRLSGAYTIGGANPDFPTVSEAVAAAYYPGVCGQVVFNIRSGTYTELINIPETLFPPSVDYEIIFQSETGNSADVILTAPAVFPAPPTLVLNGAKHVAIQNLTVKSPGTTFHRPVELKNGASDIRFINNVLEGKQTDFTTNDYAVVFAGGSACNNLTFEGNTVKYGSKGIVLSGIISAYGTGNLIANNRFEDQRFEAISCIRQSGPRITGNIVVSNSNNSSMSGIRLDFCRDTFHVSKNKIELWAGSGLSIYACNIAADGQGWVTNNFMQTGIYAYPSNGIRVEESHHLNFYFNSVDVRDNALPASSAFSVYIADTSFANTNINVQNNIFSNRGTGIVFRISHSIFNISINNVFNVIDNNAYHSTGDVFATVSTFETSSSPNLTSLEFWKIILNKDYNSFITDPQFGGDLHIIPQSSNYLLSGSAVPVPGVFDDIDGEPRDPLTPDIGADEFHHPASDAGVVAMLNATQNCSGVNPVYIMIKNYGTDTLYHTAIHWAVNGILQTPHSWNGSLAAGEESAPIYIGDVDFLPGGSHYIEARTDLPNGTADLVAANDGFFTVVFGGGLSGVYTVGGADPDFPTFTAARDALVSNGVCGQATFKVRSGIYNEQVSFPQIPGASHLNTITFESENGYNTSVLMTYSANSANNYTLQLDGADYFTFKNMSFTATNNTDYNTVLMLKNSSNHNRFLHNRFLGLDFPLNYNWYVLANSDSSLDEFNLFEGNFFKNGSYAVQMNGNYNGTGPVIKYEKGNRFINNTISGAKKKSLHLQYQQDPVVEKNTILLEVPVWAGFTNGGIQLDGSIGKIRISGNKVTGSAESGIRVYGSRSSKVERGLIANNFVGITNATGVTVSGAMVLGNCIAQDVVFNNLLVYGTIPYNCYALHTPYAFQSDIVTMNNNFVNLTGLGACIYTQVFDPVSVSDYNNYFATSGILAQLGGLGNFSNLQSMQNATGFEGHSQSTNPLFVSNTDLHLSDGNTLQGAGTPVPGILYDIDGDGRDPSAPYIGADEFTARTFFTLEELSFISGDTLDGWNVPAACGNEAPVVLPCDSTGNVVFHLQGNMHCSGGNCTSTGIHWFIFDGMTLIAEGDGMISFAGGQNGAIDIPYPSSLFSPGVVYALTIQYDCGECTPCECPIKFIIADCGACTCLGFFDTQFGIDGAAAIPAQCDQQPLTILTCPAGSGISFFFEGVLSCTDTCNNYVNWEIRHPWINTPIFSGSVPATWLGGSANHFRLPNLAFSSFPFTGNYSLILEGQCGDSACACSINFQLPYCDVCVCPALSDMNFIQEGGNMLPAACNDESPVELACPLTSDSFSFSGEVLCSDSCVANVNYRILNFQGAVLQTGSTSVSLLEGNLYRFSLPDISYNILPGAGYYRLELESYCGQKTCGSCTIHFYMPPCDFCCLYYDNFTQAVESATMLTQNNIACTATLNIGTLPNCGDYIGPVNWGDGMVSAGPFGTGAAIAHTYAGAGDYVVSYTAFELDGNGQVCFEKLLTDTISVSCEPCDAPAFSLGLTGHFPFDGNAGDHSPSAINGIVNGATLITGQDGAPNSAYRFNGSSSWINLGTNNRGISNAVSVCAWVRTTETAKGQWVAGKYLGYLGTGYNGYLLTIGDELNQNIGKAAFGGRNGAQVPFPQSSGFSATAVNDGQWHCLVGVAGNDSWNIYVDGFLESSAEDGTENLATPNYVPFTIGWHDGNTYPLWMNGDIDDVRIYNRALTAHEVECFCAGDITTLDRDLMRTSEFQLHPNPTPGQFTLELPQPATPSMRIHIIGLTGQTLLEKEVEPGAARQLLDVGNLPAGLYFLQVWSEGKIAGVAKLVKQ